MNTYVPAVAPLSRRNIENDAEGVLRSFFPQLLRMPGAFPVLDFFDILKDNYSLDPGVEELPAGVEGMTYPDGRVLISEETYRAATRDQARARFTIPQPGRLA